MASVPSISAVPISQHWLKDPKQDREQLDDSQVVSTWSVKIVTPKPQPVSNFIS
jgi:hypothetical protein